MNIPPKYEDVVAQIAEATDAIEYMRKERVRAEGREAELRATLKVANTNTKQILERESETVALKQRDLIEAQTAVTGWARKHEVIQQRLTVAEQRAGELAGLVEEGFAAIPGQQGYDGLLSRMLAALKPAEEGEGS